METIKLNVGERLVAMQLTPSENNYATMRIIRYLKEKLGLSAEEYKEFEVEEVHKKVHKEGMALLKKAEEATTPEEKQKLKIEGEKTIERAKKLLEKGEGGIAWNEKGMVEKDIEFRTAESNILRDSLKKLDKEKKMEERHFSLYEKFVKPEEDDYAKEDREKSKAGEKGNKKS